jgi:uncharacterized DUF497 family protein
MKEALADAVGFSIDRTKLVVCRFKFNYRGSRHCCNLYWLPLYIMADGFEWDRVKAAANYKKHGVRFEHAVAAFEDVFVFVELDDSGDHGEDRFIMTGRAAGSILVVVFTERKEQVRIISAREATEHERRNNFREAQED